MAGDLPATRTTITVRTFGWPTWRRVVERDQAEPVVVTLPRPWLFMPQSVTTETVAPGTANGAPQVLSQTDRAQAGR